MGLKLSPVEHQWTLLRDQTNGHAQWQTVFYQWGNSETIDVWLTPTLGSLARRMSRSTVSKALFKSINTTPVTKPLSIFSSLRSVTWSNAVTVECSCLKPDCATVRSLNSSKNRVKKYAQIVQEPLIVLAKLIHWIYVEQNKRWPNCI